MRVLLANISHLNSVATHFIMCNANGQVLLLPNELVCIIIAQGGAKLPEFKEWGRKIRNSNLGCQRVVQIGTSSRIFLRHPVLTFGSFVHPWATSMIITLFWCHEHEWIGFSLLRSVILAQSTLSYVVLIFLILAVECHSESYCS